nr:hypothetical protein [Tanacetum cinerariifolium]
MNVSSISEAMQPTIKGRLKKACNQITYLETPNQEVGLKTPHLICDYCGGPYEADECEQNNPTEQSSVRAKDRQTFQAHTLRQQNNKQSARELHNYREGTFSCALHIRQVPSILGLIQDHFFMNHSALRATTARKVFEAGFYWPHIFRHAHKLHKAYWAIKNCNLKRTKAGANQFLQINELDEIRLDVYESSISYRERTKRWHDKWIEAPTNYEKGDKVILFNSRLRLFPEKLKSRWYGPFSVCKDMKNGAVELYDEDGNKLIVNKQWVKAYQKSVLDTNKDDGITLDDEGEVTKFLIKKGEEISTDAGDASGFILIASRLQLEPGDGVTTIKRWRHDIQGDGVRDLETASGCGRLKVDLEPSTWRQRQEYKVTPS